MIIRRSLIPGISSSRWLPLLVGCLLVALQAGTGLAAGTFEPYERWYVIEMMGERAGWASERRHLDDEGNVVSENTFHFKIARGVTDVEMSFESTFTETPDGEPIRMSVEQNLGTLGSSESRFVFTDDALLETSTQFGMERRKRHPLPTGTWLTPAEVSEFVHMRIRAGADRIQYATIDPMTGVGTVTAVMNVLERTKVEAMGKIVPATKWESSMSIMPDVKSIEFVDDNGRPIRTEVNFGGMSLVVLASDKAFAMSEFKAPELMASTLVKPDRPIEEPRDARRATYVLSMPDSEMPDMPDTGAQRVERIDDRQVRVIINLDQLHAAPVEEVEDARYREPSDALDATDPRIVELTKQATADAGDDPAERAEAIRRFVHSYIEEKGLGVGFATATEVCVTKEGDCSEHGVLLAAMLRADGTPSRVVSGLMYINEFLGADHVFGYHMWAQALLPIDGKPTWVDLDAVLPAISQTDATHIVVSTAALSDAEDDTLNSMVILARVFGALEIKVEEISP